MWEEVEWFGCDSAHLAVTDARARAGIDAGEQLVWESGRNDDQASIAGYPCGAWYTSEDCPAQIEAARDADGEVIAVRVETVSDVAELDGEWAEKHRLDLPTGQAAVVDPYCWNNRYYWREVSVRPGSYSFEVFEPMGDWPAGMRIVWQGPNADGATDG